jgi:hypothetical protein
LKPSLKPLTRVVKFRPVEVGKALGVDQHLDTMRFEFNVIRFDRVNELKLVGNTRATAGAHTKAQANAFAALGHVAGNVFGRFFRKRNCHRQFSLMSGSRRNYSPRCFL